jgi:hypothetical protein
MTEANYGQIPSHATSHDNTGLRVASPKKPINEGTWISGQYFHSPRK